MPVIPSTATRAISVVGVHCAGEPGDVVVGGVRDIKGARTMFDKKIRFEAEQDQIRQLLLQEPRGKPAMCANIVLSPCDPRADAGLLIMEHEEYPPMSGGNTIATVTVLLETGMVPMAEPVTELTLDTAAGLVGVSARCQGGRVEAVTFRNVPCFAWALDVPIDVPGLGEIKVDIAWGGMFYALVDLRQDAPAMRDLGLEVRPDHGRRLVEVGERIKRAVQAQTDPVHPENPEIRGVTIVELTEPAVAVSPGVLQASNAVVISPGRLDRCPCGTGTSARMAVMAARGQLRRGDELRHRSPIGTEFVGRVEEDRETTARCGHLDAIVPSITGSAWITGYHTYKLHPADPFPEGFRVGDIWHM